MTLREAQAGIVIAIVRWQVNGFRTPSSDANEPGCLQKGIFTHTFINTGKKWEITATQNTLIPNR